MRPARVPIVLSLLLGCAAGGRLATDPATGASSGPGSDAVAGSVPSCPEQVPVYEEGRPVRAVCRRDAAREGLTVIDLSDGWAPRMIAEDDPFREEYVALANGRRRTSDGRPVDYERHLAIFGVFPTPSVVARWMLDEARHDCHEAVGADPLGIGDLQAHLRCDGLLPPDHSTDRLDRETRRALYDFQRRSFILERGDVDRATHDALVVGSLELDFQALLRVLRERVVDATGLIEDGSAGSGHREILGRYLDPPEMRDTGLPPLPDGAPDLVSASTEQAAGALGWTDPGAAQEFFAALGRDATSGLEVAVRLPSAPRYHAEHMDLRMEIDRGDVWYDYPYRPDGRELPQPVERAPTMTLWARDGDREVALVRWSTTIGGWRRETGGDGEVGLRYKESPVGPRVAREMIVAPAWLPPPDTPDDELLRRGPEGHWIANRRIVERGWGSAFGLVMLKHHDVSGGEPVDEGIRTHGTADYESVLGGYSHGCHRVWNHLATRLGGFVLAHRRHERRGLEQVSFERELAHDDDRDEIVIRSRGYLYELTPPMPVEVLPGRIRGQRREPPEALREDPSA